MSEDINKSKELECQSQQSGNLNRKVNHLSKVIYNRNITEFTGYNSSTEIGWPILVMGIKVSKGKRISWIDQDNLIYVR